MLSLGLFPVLAGPLHWSGVVSGFDRPRSTSIGGVSGFRPAPNIYQVLVSTVYMYVAILPQPSAAAKMPRTFAHKATPLREYPDGTGIGKGGDLQARPSASGLSSLPPEAQLHHRGQTRLDTLMPAPAGDQRHTTFGMGGKGVISYSGSSSSSMTATSTTVQHQAPRGMAGKGVMAYSSVNQ